MSHLTLNDRNFSETVASTKNLLLVDFGAAWCGPCKKLEPILDDIAKEYGEKVTLAKVDVDDARTTAAQFGIMSVPTVLFFKGGQKVHSFVGLMGKPDIKKTIDGLL